MAKKATKKSEAWVYFDHIVADAAPRGLHSNPWILNEKGQAVFSPDFDTLQRLLGVPLYLAAGTQSGVPALALDVWLSYEFRRAGFQTDQVWPRPSHPRILPAPVAALISNLNTPFRRELERVIADTASIKGVTSASSIILGKNYTKQVDVVISDWATGPELLVSTKRMDSSYGKNAANRVEESYGDAKNLRLRHPLASLGFVFGLRSDIFEKAPNKAPWLFDLLEKLGQEDDAYHATCLVLMEYDGTSYQVPEPDGDNSTAELPGTGSDDETAELPAELPENEIAKGLANLPKVSILHDKTPNELAPARFLATMVMRILSTTPVTMHAEARARMAAIKPSIKA
ncbi:hypothetical protein [Devosia sp. Leaf64]|uniref:hypothetical protein n=1 Tax=Devosia sp. Leaf64 TaxID=1736229 RepID=UPI0007160573|nr:hypothetical protein [Devosia sp. Leaf64]KQN77501.1 hypothetical protein ASE94_15980 [Devosia sp. Leaf64]